jgi:hypothetical protein
VAAHRLSKLGCQAASNEQAPDAPKPRQPKHFERAMPITDSVLKALTDQQALVVFDKLTPKINRALEPEGKKVAIVNLTEEA